MGTSLPFSLGLDKVCGAFQLVRRGEEETQWVVDILVRGETWHR